MTIFMHIPISRALKSSLGLLAFVAASLATTPAIAASYDSEAPIAYMIDLNSGAVLYDRASDKRIPPASMAKMMTVYTAFNMIKKGELSLDRRIAMPESVWREWNNQGSTMFLKIGDKPTVAELLAGIITLSGNDACVLLATGLSVSEQAFTGRMNENAKKLGLSNSHFGTSMGWPDEGRTYVSARDLATLARATIEEFPQLYKRFYGQKGFTWNGISQENRNPLFGKVAGADGLKTGHTEEAGYGFTGSAMQNGRRLVMVVAGLGSYNGRIEESDRFMQWGFDSWDSRALYNKGAVVGDASVQLGDARSVPLVAPSKLGVAYPSGTSGQFKTSIRYNGPIKAPISKGDQVAMLVVQTTAGEQQLPLVAGEAVGQAGFFSRIWNGFMSLFG